jgi:predicted RNase H-like nuclease
MRAASLIAQLGEPCARDGGGRIIEVYPAAALRIWNFDATQYKRKQGAERRCALLKNLRDHTRDWLRLREDAADLCRRDDNAFDAIIAALVARASALGLTEPIPEDMRRAANIEGWIALPMKGSLDKLARIA